MYTVSRNVHARVHVVHARMHTHVHTLTHSVFLFVTCSLFLILPSSLSYTHESSLCLTLYYAKRCYMDSKHCYSHIELQRRHFK